MLVACRSTDGKVIGFCELDARKIKSSPSESTVTSLNATTDPRPYMFNLVTHKDWRRRGVAKSFIERCEELAMKWGKSKLYLKVREENGAAIALYENLGYMAVKNEEGRRLEEQQDNGSTVLLLCKVLNVWPTNDSVTNVNEIAFEDIFEEIHGSTTNIS